MIFVNIAKGYHRSVEIKGIFTVEKPFNGKFITLRTEVVEPFKNPTPRVKFLTDEDFFYCDIDGNKTAAPSVMPNSGPIVNSKALAPVTTYEQEYVQMETDEEAMDRINTTF